MASLSIAAAEFAAVLVPQLTNHIGPTAVVVTAALAPVNWRGVVVGEVAQMIATLLKAAVIGALIAALFLMAPLPSYHAASSAQYALALGGLLTAYRLIYSTYAGWGLFGYFTEENADPGRTVPRAMAWGVLGVMALYLLMFAALGHALRVARLQGADFPALDAMTSKFGAVGAKVLAAAAFVIVLSCNHSNFIPGPRIAMAMGNARYAPRWLGRANAGGTPDLALLALALGSAALAATASYVLIFVLLGTLNMLLQVITDLAFFRLRRREPDLPRPFRALLYPWAPVLALVLDTGILIAVGFAEP